MLALGSVRAGRAADQFGNAANHRRISGLLALGALTAGVVCLAGVDFSGGGTRAGRPAAGLQRGRRHSSASARSRGMPAAERSPGLGNRLAVARECGGDRQASDRPTITCRCSNPGRAKWPSGFFGHYNEAANYLIASSVLVGAAALFGRHAAATRILWALIAIAGLAAVWFTRSRGGIFGAAVAFGVFAVVALMIGKRRSVRWFAPALIAIPLIGLGIGAFSVHGLAGGPGNPPCRNRGRKQLMDNNCRLYFLGTRRCPCIGLIRWPAEAAGVSVGSVSASLIRKSRRDTITHKPEFVHNELVQSATDYGLVGVGLLVGLLGALALAAILRVFFEERPQEPRCQGRLASRRTGRAGRHAGSILLQFRVPPVAWNSFVRHLSRKIVALRRQAAGNALTPGIAGPAHSRRGDLRDAADSSRLGKASR